MLEFVIAKNNTAYNAAIVLFKQYAQWLGIDLGFQYFDKELQNVKIMYNATDGGIILCKDGQSFIACVALRKINENIAELKRMYVQPTHQHKGIGKMLLQKSIALAKKCGYKYIRLDTLNNMLPAIALYKKYGFVEIPAYYNNPIPTAVYFQLKL